MHHVRFLRCFRLWRSTVPALAMGTHNRSIGAQSASAVAAASFAMLAAAYAPQTAEASAPIPGENIPLRSSVPSAPLGRYAVADAVERILPSVVKIGVSVLRNVRMGFNLNSPVEVRMSFGSGFIMDHINGDTFIITNAHVVSDAGSACIAERVEITVTAASGESYPATLVASDATSDVAVLRIRSARQLPVAQLAESSAVRAGEFVVSVGSPLSLANSCNFGIVSCIRRNLETATGQDASGLTYFQTDLAINHGSSGAPLCDIDGKVIGVCSMKVEGGVEGIAFAIPIDYVLKVVKELRQYGTVRRPYLGLSLISMTPDLVQDIKTDRSYKMPMWLEKEVSDANSEFSSLGLIIHDVIKKGPGDVSGLQKGDVIVAIDGVSTRTASEFLSEMSFKVGTEVKVQYRHAQSGKLDTVYLTPESLDSK